MMMLNNMDRKKKKNANANNNIPIPRTLPRSIQPVIPQSSRRPSRGIGEHNAHHPKQRQCSRMSSSKTAAASMICWHPMPLMLLLLLLQLFLMLLCPLGVVGRLLDTSVACDQHNFILSLNFDAPFRGLVYTEEGFPNCIYVNGTMLSHLSYQLKIPLHGCETRTNADGNFENGIIIQENVAFLQATDKKYLLTCIPSSASGGASSTSTPPPESVPPTTRQPSPPPTTTSAAATVEHRTTSSSGGLQKLPFFPSISSSSSSSALPPALGAGEHAFGRENAVTVDFGGVTVDQSLTSPVSVRGTLPPSLSAEADQQNQQQQLPPPAAVPELKYTVEIRAGHALDAGPISAALNIGDPISYVVRLQKPVSESQIGRCWASDSKSSLELSDEHGCSLQPRGNIWSQFERVELPTELAFVNRIKAWAFPTSNEVNIFCNLRVCMSRHCSFATNCSDATSNQPNERRRREEDGGGGGGGFEEIETLKTSIRFRRHSTPKAAGAAEVGEGGQLPRKMEFSSLRTAYPELFEEPESWCLTLSQLLLVAASCCLASACLTVGASFLLFNLCCCNRRGDKQLLDMGGGSRLGRLLLLSRGQNGEKRAAAAAATEVDVWAMINELKRRSQQQQQMPEAATTAGERRRQQQQQQNPPPQHQTSSSRHAI